METMDFETYRGREKLYTVYSSKSDQPMIIGKTGKECAELMGIKIESFQSIVSRQRRGRRHSSRTKWTIIPDEDLLGQICPICGEAFRDHHRKYCCPECSHEAYLRQERAYNERVRRHG